MALNIPPKQSYTLNDAINYLNIFHNEKRISVLDLLDYIKSGQLRACIRLEKEEKDNKLNIRGIKSNSNNFSLSYINISNVKSSNHVEQITDNLGSLFFDDDLNWIKIWFLNDSGTFKENVYDDYNMTSYEIDVTKGDINVEFSCFCHIPLKYFSFNSEQVIANKGIELKQLFILDTVPLIQSEFMVEFCLLKNNSCFIPLDTIEVLHEDLMQCFNIQENTIHNPENTEDLENEIKTLKLDNYILQEKLEKITSDFEAYKQNNQPCKKEYNSSKKDTFIKQLLHIHYGAEVANEPQKHIRDDSNTAYKNGKIQLSFDKAGIDPEVTGKTLLSWTKDIEIKTKEKY